MSRHSLLVIWRFLISIYKDNLHSLHSQFHVYLRRQLRHWEEILASVTVCRDEFWEFSGYLGKGISA